MLSCQPVYRLLLLLLTYCPVRHRRWGQWQSCSTHSFSSLSSAFLLMSPRCSLGYSVHFVPSFSKLFFGRPRCLFPSGVHWTAAFGIAFPSILSTWPIQLQHLLLMIVLMFFWWHWASISLLEITLGQKIRRIFLRDFVWNENNFFMSGYSHAKNKIQTECKCYTSCSIANAIWSDLNDWPQGKLSFVSQGGSH